MHPAIFENDFGSPLPPSSSANVPLSPPMINVHLVVCTPLLFLERGNVVSPFISYMIAQHVIVLLTLASKHNQTVIDCKSLIILCVCL